MPFGRSASAYNGIEIAPIPALIRHVCWRLAGEYEVGQRVLDDIQEAFELFASQRDGVMKAALHPAIEEAPHHLAYATVDDEC